MFRTVKVKIQPNKSIVLNTMEIYAIVFNKHIQWAIQNKSLDKNKANEALYNICRQEFPRFPSGMIQAARDNALESLKAIITNRKKKLNKQSELWNFKKLPTKKPHSAIQYDKRTITLRGEQVSFSTITKRHKQIIQIPRFFKHISDNWDFKTGQVCFDGRQFWLHLTFEADDPELLKDNKITGVDDAKNTVTGVDRGIYNIATTDDGIKFSGKRLMAIRRKYFYNRRSLQAKGTRSARRRLRLMRGSEKRFSSQENHVISKKIATNARNIIAIEDLSKIPPDRTSILNKWVSDWKFYELGVLLTYKAKALGKCIELVDPAYTSQTCYACKYISKKNRNGNKFCCKKCGYSDHAE